MTDNENNQENQNQNINENQENQTQTKQPDKLGCLAVIIGTCVVLFLIVGMIFVVISATKNNSSSSNDSQNNTSIIDTISQYNFHNSYIINYDQAIDMSIPFISSQRKITVTGDIQNTGKRNNFNIILEINNKNNTQIIATKNIKRVLDKNQIYEFSFTVYVEEEVGNYRVRIEEF